MCTQQIQVYAQFPRTVTLNSDLDLNLSNWIWVHCLTIPLEILDTLHFSQRSYKWIRYAISVVTGAHGDLSLSSDTPSNVLDYNAGLPTEATTLYYHACDDERRGMLPADPDTGRTSIPSSRSLRMGQFRDDVGTRDGWQCVLVDDSEVACDAAHLLPHCKGDAYISNYTQRQSRDRTGNDIVVDIDCVRNGVFLNGIGHRWLGKCIAFLMTPNFAMSTADVDPTAAPTEKRCSVHLFGPDQQRYACYVSPSGSPVRMPDTTDDWPPDILFDAVYASAVLYQFSTQALQCELDQKWNDSFNPVIIDDRATNNETQAEEGRTESPDLLDMLMILPYVKVPQKQLEAVHREAEEKRADMERSRLEDMVVGWAKGVTDV